MADALLWESGGAVESQPLVAVGEIDDAAVGEARFLQAVAHDGVVAVGVDADVVAVAASITPWHSGRLAMRCTTRYGSSLSHAPP